MKMKKMLSLLVALTMLFSTYTPYGVAAEPTVVIGDIGSTENDRPKVESAANSVPLALLTMSEYEDLLAVAAADNAPEVTASATEITLDGFVTFTVSAPGATMIRVESSLYAGYDTFAASGDVTDIVLVFSDAEETVRFSAYINDEWTAFSEPITIRTIPVGQLEATIISAEDINAGHDLHISWTAIENAVEYYICIIEEASGKIWDSVWVDAPACEFSSDVTLVPGNYTVNVQAEAVGWVSSVAEKTISVTGDMAEGPDVSVNVTETLVNDASIIVTISAPNAEKVRLRYSYGGKYWLWREAVIKDGFAEISIYPSSAGEMQIAANAYIDGIWSNYSDPISVLVTSKGTLDAPVLAFDQTVTAGQSLTITWPAVDNAEIYHLGFSSLDVYEGVFEGDDDEGIFSYTVPLVLEEGIYDFYVISAAEGWEDGTFRGCIKVTGKLKDAPVVTVEQTDISPADDLIFTVTCAGAEKLSAKISGKYDTSVEMYDSDGDVTEVWVYGYLWDEGINRISFSALVDGVWTAYSEEIEIDVTYIGELNTPVLVVPAKLTAGQDLCVDWDWDENVENYFLSLYRIESGEEIAVEYGSLYSYIDTAGYTFKTPLSGGTYKVNIYASTDGWDSSSASYILTVGGTLADGPSFTVDKTTVAEEETVTFTVQMDGATRFRLNNGSEILEQTAVDGAATFVTQFDYSRVATCLMNALVDGFWTDYGPAVDITVQDRPKLGKAVITVPDGVRAGEDFIISWTPVEHAEYYDVSVRGNNSSYYSDVVDGAENSVIIPAGELKQGNMTVRVSAQATGYETSYSDSYKFYLLAPLTENMFSIRNYGNGWVITEYLGETIPETLEIPTIYQGKEVSGLYWDCFSNNNTLKKITIPQSVTFIAEDAFSGSTNLTICGYTGSYAEGYAKVYGHTFEALDNSESLVGATWTTPVPVNNEMTFTLDAAGATQVRVYQMEETYRSNVTYQSTILLTETGASIMYTPDTVGTMFVQFEALINGEWVPSPYYSVEVVSHGKMPAATNLTATPNVIHPGEKVTISWTAPETEMAVQYNIRLDNLMTGSGYGWTNVPAGDTSYTYSGSPVLDKGLYIAYVEVEAFPGYQPTSSSVPFMVVASDSEWEFYEENHAIIAYNGKETDLQIPSEIDGSPVTTIYNGAFSNGNYTSIVVPEGIEHIMHYAFRNCSSLSSVILPSTLKYLQSSVFEDCISLTNITLPSGLKTIDYSAFYGCTSLSEVVIPNGVNSINAYAFANCKSLELLTIPQSVTSIESSAFSGCDNLTIYGYAGSEAESFANRMAIPFVALDTAETGNISFALASGTVYQHGYANLIVTAPDAQKLRVHYYDGWIDETRIVEHEITDVSVVLSQYLDWLGETKITVSQCVNGVWMAPCTPQTVTVVAMEVPESKIIEALPARSELTVEWKAVRDASRYYLELRLDETYTNSWHFVPGAEATETYIYTFPTEALPQEGIYTLTIYAHAEDGGYSKHERTFEVTAPIEFLYELDGENATIISYIGEDTDVMVPAQLDGYTVTRIASKAFLDCGVGSVVLPETIEVIEGHAFEGCEYLSSITVGEKAWAERNAFANCRTDTVIYGYSGGTVELEAEDACNFSAVGELASAPDLMAADIYMGDQLVFSANRMSADKLRVYVVHPSEKVYTSDYAGDAVERGELPYDLSANSFEVIIRVCASVDGMWSAFATKTITVQVMEQLGELIFHEIDSLPIHLEHTISWIPVENAENYHVVISGGMNSEMEADLAGDECEIVLEAGTLQPGEASIVVTAEAKGYLASTNSMVFETYIHKLFAPQIAVAEKNVRHENIVIEWLPVEYAESYDVEVMAALEDGTVLPVKGDFSSELSYIVAPEKLYDEANRYTVSVIAKAEYCDDSDAGTAVFEVYRDTLEAPVLTVPDNVVGGEPIEVTWEQVANAQNYVLEVLDSTENVINTATLGMTSTSFSLVLGTYLEARDYIIRLSATHPYWETGMSEKAISYMPLFSYQADGDEAYITAYNGTASEVHVPANINGLSVTRIDDRAFEDNEFIVRVFLPDNVSSIGSEAFKNCIALEWIAGDGVTEVENSAFYNCTSLRYVHFANNNLNVQVGQDAFANTPYFSSASGTGNGNKIEISIEAAQQGTYSNNPFIGKIFYQEGVTAIPVQAHYNNISLNYVGLPSSLRTIGSEAFASCGELRLVSMYDTIESIGDDAFDGDEQVYFYIYTYDEENISYVERYALDHQIPYSKIDLSSDEEERDEHNLYSYVYKEGTVNIPERDLYQEERLEIVETPETLKTIGSESFAYCPALTTFYVHDGVESIAEDAFEGSENVRFIIYTDDTETISYAEQYAIDHSIPYQKYALSSEEEIEIGQQFIGETIYVRLGETRSISFDNIPPNATRLLIYMDDLCVRSVSTYQSESVVWQYTFSALGAHTLRAEAYLGQTLLQDSWIQPVVVQGIALSAVPQSCWAGEPVTFTLKTEPAVSTLKLYADHFRIATVDMAGENGQCEYAFTKSGTRKVYAVDENGVKSDEITVWVKSLGQLEKPVLMGEEQQWLNENLTFQWNQTANTDGYVLYLLDNNGAVLTDVNIEAGESEQMSYAVPVSVLQGPGVYHAYLMNYGYQYDQNQSDSISITVLAPDKPVFSMDKSQAFTGEDVTFTVTAYDATRIQMIIDGRLIEEFDVADHQYVFIRPFTQSGDREVFFRVLVGEEWKETESKIIQIMSNGQLDTFDVNVDQHQILGKDISVSWTNVANADGYIVRLYNANGDEVYHTDTARYSVDIPADSVVSSGAYTVLVVAYGMGYDQREASAIVNVTEALPGPVILTPSENENCAEQNVLVTWQTVEGADSYVITLARKTGHTDETNEPIYEKVWEAPNETINVGSVLSHELTNLVYGAEYRVAVGAVAKLNDGTTRVGWTERLFAVSAPELHMTLSISPDVVYEKQEAKLIVESSHSMTQASLTTATGEIVPVISSSVAEVEGKRIFTYVFTESTQGEKSYTITVSGTDELSLCKPVSQQITINWLDGNMPQIIRVNTMPASCWPGTDVSFEILANDHVSAVDVYWIEDDETVFQTTMTAATQINEGKLFEYVRRFEEAGGYTIQFTPVNADGEWKDSWLSTYTVLPEGILPAPEVVNLANGDIVTQPGFTVQWAEMDLSGAVGGFSVTVYEWNEDTDWWKVLDGYYNIGTGMQCSYQLPIMEAGQSYRIEVYSLLPGTTVPSAEFSGCAAIDFSYRTVPEFELTAIETDGILNQPVTVRWQAPAWLKDEKLIPDRYVIWWYGPGVENGVAFELEGRAVSHTLLAEYVQAAGNYTVDVYACLGEAQRLATGSNGFEILMPDISLTGPADHGATYLTTDHLDIAGTAVGGITTVMARLVGENQTPIPLKAADGSTVEYLVVSVVDNSFSVRLTPAEALTPSVGDKTDHAIEVYGFMEGIDAVIGNDADRDYRMIDIDDGELLALTANGYGTNYWLFHDEWIKAGIKTNMLIDEVSLYADGVKKNVEFAVEDDEKAYTRQFTSKSFRLQGEGQHVLKAECEEWGKTLSMNVFVVTRLEEKLIGYYNNTAQQLKTYKWPLLTSATGPSVSAACELTIHGSCGAFYFATIDDNSVFVLKKDLDISSSLWKVYNEDDIYLKVENEDNQLSQHHMLIVRRKDEPSNVRVFNQYDLLITKASNGRYVRRFKLSSELGLEMNHSYEVAIVPYSVSYDVSALRSFPYSFTYGQSKGLILPSPNDNVVLWGDHGITVEWYSDSEALYYLLNLELMYAGEYVSFFTKAIDPNSYSGESSRIGAIIWGDDEQLIKVPEHLRKQVLPARLTLKIVD